jgi:hypothetical protein
MSRLNKALILAALAFCAAAFAQGPAQGTGAGFPATAGSFLNQSAGISATTIATCSAAHYCLYLAAMTLACNPANPATGTGSVQGALSWSDGWMANQYNIVAASLNIGTCTSLFSTYTSFLDHPLMVGAGKTVTAAVTTAGVTGSYNYDAGWLLIPISQF